MFANVKIADFDATHAVGLLISNQYFNQIGMDELEKVKDNHATMKKSFEFLGIKEVIEVRDSYDDMVKAYNSINAKCIEAHASEGKI